MDVQTLCLRAYRNGQLRSEQSAVEPWFPGPSAHVYQDSIGYDLNGRRILLKYPSIIAPSSGNTLSYWYSSRAWGPNSDPAYSVTFQRAKRGW
jgi:hypothetical protein